MSTPTESLTRPAAAPNPAAVRLSPRNLNSWAKAVSGLVGVPVLALAGYALTRSGVSDVALLGACAAAVAVGYAGVFWLVRSLIRQIRGLSAAEMPTRDAPLEEIAAVLARLEANAQTLRAVHVSHLHGEEAERRRLARELHDELGQELALLLMWLQRLQQESVDSGTRAQMLRSSAALAASVLERVRSMALDLRPAQLDDLGLAPALRALARRVGRQTGITVTLLALPETEPRLADATKTALFRIAQAAVTNAVRHAGASTLWIGYDIQDGMATVKVQDDGCGFDPEEVRSRAADGSGMGLLVMQERVQALGGKIGFISGPGAGTLVSASIPTGPLPSQA
jgi:signal transduction histidine kinase